MKMPGQPSSHISPQMLSSYSPASASSRSFSALKRALRNSRAVDLIACWSSVKSKFMSRLAQPGQAEHALGDDVLEDLGRAALDRVRAGAQEAVGPLVVHDRRVGAHDLHRQLGERLVGVGPPPLDERALGAGDAGLHLLGQAARGGQPQALGLDVELGDLLADDGVLVHAALARQLHQLAEGDLELDRRAEAEPRALVHQRGDGDHPAVALAADDVLVRDPSLLDEELVELRLAGYLAQRPDLHRLLLHIHDEVGEALVLGGVEVGARDEHAPLRLVRERGPDLLPGHDPLAVRLHGLRLERREVGAGLGLGEALAPDLVGGEDRLEEALLLLLGAVRDHDRAAHHEAEHVRGHRRPRAHHLLVEERLLDQRGAAAAVLLGPRQSGVARVVQLVLPLAAEPERVNVARRLLTRVVVLKPLAQLVAEGLLVWAEGQVHAAGRMLHARPTPGAPGRAAPQTAQTGAVSSTASRNALATRSSNWRPANERISSRAVSAASAGRYGRSRVIASWASQTRITRAPSGMSSPARPSG